ncbi:MAG: PAS domain-containing protein [Alphaproteobacteria bacterium]|nr:PAS domain-containing protein [Alphaproteobacteria bacterium]
MTTPPRRRSGGKPAPVAAPLDASTVLAALANPVLVIDRDGFIRMVNPAAEQFFGTGAPALNGAALATLFVPHSPLLAMIDTVRRVGNTMSEHDVLLEGPRFGTRIVTIQVTPLADAADQLVLSLHERSMVDKLDRQLTHRNAARSVTAMAAMLAHEVKNPLSGIRGAAQLLEQDAGEGGRQLTRLICDETDRIVALVERMEAFASDRPTVHEAVNIHEVLERVRKVAQSGFARHVNFVEEYDPSLPPVYGNRDQLVQVFLNLVKNAAEAVPSAEGEIILTTGYRHGLRLTGPGGEVRRHLPLMVAVTDNGAGIPEDLRPHLFDPFVTTKRNGTGLGLALVAKVIGDHGGVIEFDSQPRRTVFRVYLPVVAQDGIG